LLRGELICCRFDIEIRGGGHSNGHPGDLKCDGVRLDAIAL
jgi:hypothetical protein